LFNFKYFKNLVFLAIVIFFTSCSSDKDRPENFINTLSEVSLKTIIDISPNSDKIIVKGIGPSVIQDVNNAQNFETIPIEISMYNKMWSWNPDYLIMTLDNQGNENDQIFSYNLKTKTLLPLSPADSKNGMLTLSHKHPDDILILSNKRDKKWFDIYKVNIKTGKSKIVYENKQFNEFLAEDDLTLKAAVRENGTEEKEIWMKKKDKWTKQFSFSSKDTVDLMHAHENYIYLLDNRRKDKKALVQWNTLDNSFNIIAQDNKSDITHVLFDKKTGNPTFYRTNYLFPKWRAVEDKYVKAIKNLEAIENGTFELGACNADKTKCVATYLLENNYKFYLYDFEKNKALFLLSSSCYLDTLSSLFSKTYPLEIKARDGTILPSYLTIPKESDQQNKGRTKTPVPMIVTIHGGPWERDEWGFSPIIQKYAAMGFAVLQVNYRGSDGFGKEFLNQGQKELGNKMIDDIIDGVQWAVSNKIADPKKIILLGGSYGGFAVYRSLQKAPNLFAGGIVLSGFGDLKEFIENIPTYWEGVKGKLHDRIGNPETEEKLLKKQSPLSYVNTIKKPLLIFHGRNDPRVSADGTRKMVNKLLENGVDVTYVEFPDEGHAISFDYNANAYTYLVDKFLSKYTENDKLIGRNKYVLEKSTGQIYKNGKFYPLAYSLCQ
tara:strand:+ start:2150 stop:4132 length:1983 start_codon:yes stop_codon:yes gene_type:complete